MTNNLSWQITERTLFLSGSCSFASVAQLDRDAKLQQALASLPADSQMDLSAISNSSSAILPLLLQIKRSAEKLNKKIQLTAVPERLLAMIKLAELDQLLLN
jgi:hypothetical protein